MTPRIASVAAPKSLAQSHGQANGGAGANGAAVNGAKVLRVILTTTHRGHQDWSYELDVPVDYLIKDVKAMLEKAPFGLKLTKLGSSESSGSGVLPLHPEQKVPDKIVLMGFNPDTAPMLKKLPASQESPKILFKVMCSVAIVRCGPSKDDPYVGMVRRDQMVSGWEEGYWLRLDAASADLLNPKPKLRGPFYVPIDGVLSGANTQVKVVLQRCTAGAWMQDELAREPCLGASVHPAKAEVLDVAGEQDWRPLPESVRPTQDEEEDDERSDWRPLPECYGVANIPAPMEQNHWEPMDVLCDGLRVQHGAEAPRDRRAKSWARTLAYAQVKLGLHGVPVRRGTPERPFLIWVLGASEQIEVNLAMQGFFGDANWVDRAPTEVVLFGEGLKEMSLSQDAGATTSTRRGSTKQGTTVKKDDAATFSVVYEVVAVREEPSTGARMVGQLFKGQEVHGREESGWVRLDAASVKLCNEAYEGSAWVMIDEKKRGVGRLLKRERRDGKAKGSRASGDVHPDNLAADDLDAGPQEGQPPELHSMSYEGLHMLRVSCDPDLVVLFMPAFEGKLPEEGEPGVVPETVLEALIDVPIVVTTRCALPEASIRVLRARLGLGQLLLEPSRCPFSAAAGAPGIKYDDNGWILGVQGSGALGHVLNMKVKPDYPAPLPEKRKVPAVFWGIVDLKYDPRQPIFERVKMLESGDGRTSKFSGDGADIPQRVKDHYQVEEGMVLRKHHFVSADKKLTHDLMELCGYEHLVPLQAHFPRCYDLKLAERIMTQLDVHDGDHVVLKLINRSRAAGVLVVPVDELDEVLEEILVPPKDLEAWLGECLERLEVAPADLSVQGPFDEQRRHWWANESPTFVVERRCTSIPTVREGRPYDGTMRVAFALCRKNSTQAKVSDTLDPEDLEVEWLGGYWKLPKTHMESDDLRERIISAARTSGTAPVSTAHLFEVFAALGDSIQQLFGGAEPNPDTLSGQYKKNLELAAYMTARLGMTMKENLKARQHLASAEKLIDRPNVPVPMKACVKSFIKRGHGVLCAKEIENNNFAGRWDNSVQHLRMSSHLFPTNASTMYLLGMAMLDQGKTDEAKTFMNKSLLLDPDHRATYVNLGVAYLRLGCFTRAIEISDAGLARFPQSPQSYYHIGVACCQLALEIDEREMKGGEVSETEDAQFEAFRARAHECFTLARDSSEAEKRKPQPGKHRIHPWTSVDQEMVDTVSSALRPGKRIELPTSIGWRFYAWRV